MKIFIVIPTYNEKENICRLTEKIFKLKIDGLGMIIIDDNSPDGTGPLIDELAKKYSLTTIHRPDKQGLGSAYRLGLKMALDKGADLIFQMDADFSHDPNSIPVFLEEIKNGAEIVIGSRRIRGGKIIGWNWWRHFCSLMASSAARLLLNLKTKDVTSGFRCYQRRALEQIDINKIKSSGYAFFEEITYLAEQERLKIKETPIIFLDRQTGKSKLGSREIIKFFKTIARLWLEKNKSVKK